MNLQSWRVVAALGRRSVLQTFRRPQLLAPLLIFPTLLLAIQTGGPAAPSTCPASRRSIASSHFLLAGGDDPVDAARR